MGVVVNVPQAGLDLVLFGDKSNIITNYLSNQLNYFNNAYSQLNEFTKKIYDQLYHSYQFLTNKFIQSNIRNSLNKEGLNVYNEYIHEINKFEDFVNANTTMIRWIMANPSVRQEYLNNNIEGYNEQYKNLFGSSIGVDHYDYRRVMDGVLVDENDRFLVRYYHDFLLPGDRPLNRHEKIAILNTWSAAEWLIENCKFDFTAKDENGEYKKRNI